MSVRSSDLAGPMPLRRVRNRRESFLLTDGPQQNAQKCPRIDFEGRGSIYLTQEAGMREPRYDFRERGGNQG
jgi:hypothetical protein